MNNIPDKMSAEAKERITILASQMFSLPKQAITKEHMLLAIKMDMTTSIVDLQVSCSSTRPSEVKFATNNYHVSAKIDMSGIYDVIMKTLEQESTDTLIDKYFELKRAALSLTSIKYESMEQYLRDLLFKAEQKDDMPKVGRYNNE